MRLKLKRDKKPKREIWLSSLPGNAWPLWESRDGGDRAPMSPADYELSEPMTAALADWFQLWTDHYIVGTGWDTVANYWEWYTQADFIAQALKREVGSYAIIVVDVE